MKVKILLVLCLCFLVSGCWNYNELNDLAIVTGIGIDKHEEGYKVSLMISNSQSIQGSSKEGEAQTTVFTGIGENITEALTNIGSKNPRNIYLGHLAVAVIDEEIAKDDINPILEALIRNPETAKKYYVILARENKAEDILKSLSPLESFPSQNISLNIESTSRNQGIITNTILSEFIITLLKPGINNVAPSISIQGDENKIDNQDDLKNSEPNAMLKIRTMGLFKDYKLMTWTTENESKGINIVNNSIDRLYIKNKFENEKYVSVLVDNSKCNPKLTIDDDLSVILNIKADGAIVETNTKFDLEDEKTIEKLNKKTEDAIKNMVYEGIKISKKYKTDIFGFGNMIYRQDFNYWNKIKNEWDDVYFPDLNIKVKVKVNLKSKGSLENTIREEKNES